MSTELRYCEDYAVEEFDFVELLLDGAEFEGQVKALHPKRQQVTVSYLDHTDLTRAGNPRRRRAKVSVDQILLHRRDG